MILEWRHGVLVDRDGSCVTRLELGKVALEGFHVGGSLAAGGRGAQLHRSLFLICHGRATPSLISSTYSFTCGLIFLSFFILQGTHGFTSNVPPLALVLSLWFFFFFWRECGVACFSMFFVCLFPKIISGFMGLLENGLVTMFMGLFMVWFGFLDLFLIFLDFVETEFGCWIWIWIWGLLEISFGCWVEHEERVLKLLRKNNEK